MLIAETQREDKEGERVSKPGEISSLRRRGARPRGVLLPVIRNVSMEDWYSQAHILSHGSLLQQELLPPSVFTLLWTPSRPPN